MRPPFLEASALLAAHGHSAAPAQPIHPVARSLIMADMPNYAFLPRIDAVTRPIVCADLMALARHIERKRNGQSFQLIEVEDIEHDGRMHQGVKVMLLDMANEPEACLGFAWLRGSGRAVLEPALRAARQQVEAADQQEAA